MRAWFRFGLILVLGGLSFLDRAEAEEWAIVGPRALGMGGANVAVANDASASYWNPGAYGFFGEAGGDDYGNRRFSAQLADVGVGAQVHENLGEELDRIRRFDFDALSTGQISADKVPDFIGIIDALRSFDANKNRAATILVNAGVLRMQIGHFGIGGLVTGSLSAKGDIDLVNISPVSAAVTFTLDDFTNPINFGCPSPCSPSGAGQLSASDETAVRQHLSDLGWTLTQQNDFINAMNNGLVTATANGVSVPPDIATQINNVATVANAAANAGGTFDQNTSSLLFRGIAVAEIPLTYGRAITEDFSIGGNIKFMKARVYNSEVKIFNNDFGDALDKARDDYADSQNFGIDLGLLYRFGDDLRVGLVGRNLNSPRFDMKNPLTGAIDDHITEKPQVRTGVAYKPLGFITLAADLDLTRNDTTVGGDYKSQNLGAGIELSLLKILQLRGGIYTNIAKSDIGPVFTAGLGLNLWLVNLDVGASLAGKSAKIDEKSVPKEARAEFALSMLF